MIVIVQSAFAQPYFEIGSWDGTLELGTDFRREDTSTRGAATSTFQSLRFEERVGLRNAAVILDPRLAFLTFGGTFGLFQERTAQPSEVTHWDDARPIRYDVSAFILREKPYALTLSANRSMSRISREFAGTSDVESENMGATLNLRNPYFPSSLSFRRERADEETRLFGGVSRREEARLITTYSGRQTWDDSDLDVRYTFTDLDNLLAPAQDFQSHDLAVHYRLTFGEEVEKNWTSGLQLFRREGLAPSTLLSANQNLSVLHAENLSTSYQYTFLATEAEAGTTLSHSGSAGLSYRLYESLGASLSASGSFSDQPGGETKSYSAGAGLSYQKRVLWGGRLAAGAGASYGLSDEQLSAGEVTALQERHEVPLVPPFVVVLNNRRVIPGSIVVTDAAGAIIHRRGFDYDIRQVDDRTELEFLPPPGGIRAGDAILVDYRFERPPRLKYTTTSWRSNVSLDYSWLRLAYSFDRTDQDLLEGTDSTFLEDTTRHEASVQVRWGWEGPSYQVSLFNEVRRLDSTRQDSDSVRLNQVVTYRITRDATANFSTDESFVRDRKTARDTANYVLRGTLTWGIGLGLSADGFLAIRLLRDSGGVDENAFEAGLRGRWIIRQLELLPSLEYRATLRDGTDSRDYRAELRVIRRF